MTIEEVVTRNDCTGCGACSKICPKGCISLSLNYEGFLYPSIKVDNCIDCGACLRACHTKKPIPEVSSEGFIVVNRDSETLSESSSGGAFSALAAWILEGGGVVYGAAFSEGLHVRHVRVANPDDLQKLQGSKYVQSEIGDTYRLAKVDLEAGLEVLFSGTPCQIAGLKAYLGKDDPNLLTVDLVCHGVPSPGFWERYIDDRCRKRESYPISAKFRLKTRWERGSYALRIKDSKGVTTTSASHDLYYALFLKGLTFRESCYACPYASMRRPGDLTVGDCNSIDYYPDFMPTEVVSILLINNEKGEDAWSSVRQRVVFTPLDVNREAQSNAQLNHPFIRPDVRDDIYARLNSDSLENLEKCYLERPSCLEVVKNIIRHIFPLSARVAVKRLIRKRGENAE